MVNDTITLNFKIEKGEPIDRYYFSARIKLADESKNLLREKLGSTIQFDNLDDYLDLNHENFYIYYNKYGGYYGRDELYVRDNNSRHLTSNLPLNHYRFSIELSLGEGAIADYGFYPLAVIYNPNHYNKAKEKVFDDHGELSQIASNMLDNFLSNKNSLTTQDIFLQIQNEIAEKEAKLVREKRQAEEELDRKNEELQGLMEKGEITLFKVVKGHDIGDRRSAVILQRDGEEVILDSSKYYIAEYEDSEFLHCDSSGYDMLLDHNDLFFVLNRSSYPELESGFYSIYEFNSDSYAKYLDTKNRLFSDDQLPEKLSNGLEEDSNQVDTKFTINDEQVDEEVVVESEAKFREKRAVEEDDNDMEDSDNSVNIQARDEDQKSTTVKLQENSVPQELIKKLFPNKESVIINDKLTIEVKYGGLTSYTPEYIKQTVKDAYGAWSENFYSQKGNHDGPVKLQLYVLKNYDEYKTHIRELSGGKDHNELWGGGTVRAHEADGTIAKTFIIGDVNGLLCAKSKILMEKMSDAFLEYATGNLNEVPEVLRTGMKLFMWSYDVAKKESTRDMHYTKEAYDKMQESGYNTPHKIASMANDYRIADCLVTFLQEKHPQFIKQLLTEISSSREQAISKFKQLLNDSEIETEFKQWMNVKSGNKVAAELVPDSEVVTFSEHKLQINIKYDNEELSQDKLSSIKDTIEGTIKDFDSAFGINNSQPWHNIPNKVNVFVFNTRSDYESYLKELNIYYKSNSGLTLQGRGSDVHVYFYLQDQFNNSCKTLKHELGHALTIINSYYGTGDVLSKSIHEGVANYMAGLENGEHVNDHGDIAALSAIQSKSLRPDEILRNDYQGKHYYSEAEQVVKFLEYEHPDLIDNLLKSLSNYGYHDRSQGNKLVEDFLAELKGYDQEFKEWVKVQLSSEEHSQHKNTEVNQPTIDLSNEDQHSEQQGKSRQKRATIDKDEQETVMASVIENMDNNSDSKVEDPNSVANAQYPLKIKTGEPLEMGKYKAVLQAQDQDMDNFYQNLSSQYTAGKYNYDQMIALYNKVYIQDSKLDGKPIILSEAYVTNNHLFIKNQDFGTLDDFNEMFYKSDELM